MKLSKLAGILHGTSLVIIGFVILLSFIMIYVLAKYLATETPDEP